jgi:hypothetical protein
MFAYSWVFDLRAVLTENETGQLVGEQVKCQQCPKSIGINSVISYIQLPHFSLSVVLGRTELKIRCCI